MEQTMINQNTQELEPQTHKPKTNPFTWFGLGVLVTVLFGSGIYLLSQQRVVVLPPGNVNASPADSSLTEVDTSFWKTYTNDKYSYSINYPSHLQLQHSVALEVSSQEPPTSASHLYIYDPNVPNDPAAFIYVAIDAYTTEPIYGDEWQKEKVNLKGIEATKLTYKVGVADSDIYQIKGLDNASILEVRATTEPARSKLANQILSTFKINDSAVQNPHGAEEKILASEVTVDCKIKIKTSIREYFVSTGYEEIAQDTRCYQFLLNQVAPSGKFVAFQDLSGGVDSRVKVHHLQLNDTLQLAVYGTSNIFDMLFLPDDRLVVLYGYPEIYTEQYMSVYDLNRLFDDYPGNVDPQYKYFKDIRNYSKSITLPDKGQDYVRLQFSQNILNIYGKPGLGQQPLATYKLSDLEN